MRSAFRAALEGFVALAGAVPVGHLDEPALGAWSVRELIGHASRAITTIEDNLGRRSDGPDVPTPAAYYRVVGASPRGSDARRQRDESIATRARASAAALGGDPGATLAEMAHRVATVVDGSDDATPVATAAGQMTLITYLPTRTFELVVHGLDLAGALDLPVPAVLRPAIAESTVLAGEIAGGLPEAPDVLLALCGRRNLPDAFSVV